MLKGGLLDRYRSGDCDLLIWSAINIFEKCDINLKFLYE